MSPFVDVRANGQRYPRIPDPPDREVGEPTAIYGARLLRWTLAESTLAGLSLDQLEAVQHASHYAVAGAMHHAARARLVDLRRMIARRIDAEYQRQANGHPGACQGSARPDLGPMARLSPTPDVRPPAPTAVNLRPAPVEIAF